MITSCSICLEPAHASETDDLDRHPECRLRAAAARLLKAQAGSWEQGNVYISVALAKELNEAMKELRLALLGEKRP